MKVKRVSGGWSVRLRYGDGQRGRFVIALEERREAERRASALAEIAGLLASAELHAEALVILRKGAAQSTEAAFREVLACAEELCGKAAKAKARAKQADSEPMTFRRLGELWTSGELARRYPDHVRAKRTVRTDLQRLAHLCETIGDVPLADFTLAHAEAATQALPSGIAPGTRRNYLQVVSKVLRLAVYPLKLIPHSPLPAGFLPKNGVRKAKAWLYPAEDARLLGCEDVPLSFRLLYGFLAREGMRYGEAMQLTWGDLDLDRGVVTLDTNKTEDPRAWSLSTGVGKALEACRPDDVGDDGLVFARVLGQPATLFRAHLKAAGVARPELFRRSESRLQIRVHDLRGTFVTLSLANGHSESWVADRTGHRSSQMINAYRRAARTASELGLGELEPLNEALGLGQCMGHEEREDDEMPGDINTMGRRSAPEHSVLV